MRKPKYQVYIDGRLAYQGNHIPYVKEQADFEFEYLNAYFAKIKTGNRVISTRFYDGKWNRTEYIEKAAQ